MCDDEEWDGSEECPYPGITCKQCRTENRELPAYCKRIYQVIT